MRRRTALRSLLTGMAGIGLHSVHGMQHAWEPISLKGNIRHSVCSWTFDDFTLEELCQTVQTLGFSAIDLVTHFDHVNRVPALASRILVEGSIRGTFTGVKLSDAINDEGTDFVDARAVINGTDRAEDIAAIANRYARVLRGPTGWATVFGRPAVG